MNLNYILNGILIVTDKSKLGIIYNNNNTEERSKGGTINESIIFSFKGYRLYSLT